VLLVVDADSVLTHRDRGIRRACIFCTRVGVSTERVFTRADVADLGFPARSLAIEPRAEPQTEPQTDSPTACGSGCMPVRARLREGATRTTTSPMATGQAAARADRCRCRRGQSHPRSASGSSIASICPQPPRNDSPIPPRRLLKHDFPATPVQAGAPVGTRGSERGVLGPALPDISPTLGASPRGRSAGWNQVEIRAHLPTKAAEEVNLDTAEGISLGILLGTSGDEASARRIGSSAESRRERTSHPTCPRTTCHTSRPSSVSACRPYVRGGQVQAFTFRTSARPDGSNARAKAVRERSAELFPRATRRRRGRH
jgi:hypothetical protein